ncbi:hypothetical protein [Aestuariivirga litoralis]|uniref:hypothetical protein n=1 Tax=Aestuariivirga litoralis TaxID=2650924 RepID=UPI0018C765FD|nr:hypothetical protein [Aestuariivirga litoralis]
MTKIATNSAKSVSSKVRNFARELFTVDPAISRMLDNTYVAVQLNNRIWMV